MKKHKIVKRAALVLLILAVLAMALVLVLDFTVKMTTKNRIYTRDELPETKDVDCILVLGAFVRPDGTPSNMLKDRLDRAIELYEAGIAPKILMSGDHGNVEYDEVNEMKQYAMDAGVPSEDIFMDHAGFSTYESMYRARDIFGADKIVVITQRYHLYRALYDAQELGLDAVGVTAKEVDYSGQEYRDLREIAARNKDFFYTLFRVKPTYLGEPISLEASGDVTNDIQEPVTEEDVLTK